jgi:stage V sporulation protein R
MFQDIEDRWNKGRFGKEWEECQDPRKKETWDLSFGQGREKIFDVRRSYSDRFFIEHFLTEQLVDDLDLYIFTGKHEYGEIKYVIDELDWKQIRSLLVAQLSTFDIPLIMVENGDYKGKRELYLKHANEGIELDKEYREKTMAHIYYLWDRPVHIESVVDDVKVVFTFDGNTHSENRQGTFSI